MLAFGLSVAAGLAASNVRWVINEPRWYDAGFQKYQAAQQTGLDSQQLHNAAVSLIQYFNSKEEPLRIEVTRGGQKLLLFNEREIIHLKDVKDMVQASYLIQILSAIYALAFLGITITIFKKDRRKRFGQALVVGGGVTILLFIIVGISSMLDFDQIFLQFHLVTFANEFWMLDPSQDYLIRMFPQGFFFDLVVLVAAMTVGEAILIGVSGLLLRRRRRQLVFK